MNEVLKTISARYSCRAFDGVLPGEEILDQIAHAAIASPSGVNRQAWRVIVVTDRALIGEMETEAMRQLAAMEDTSMYERILSRGGKLFYGAPSLILVPIDAAQMPGAALDCGILCQTAALAATSLGVANLICGLAGLAFAGEKAADFTHRLGFPEGYAFGAAILLGYAKKEGTPHAIDEEKISYIRP